MNTPTSTYTSTQVASLSANPSSSKNVSMSNPDAPSEDAEIQKLVTLLLRDYVASWFSVISDNDDFVTELIRTIAHVIRECERRLNRVDFIVLATRDLPEILKRHIYDYRHCCEKLGTSYGGGRTLDELFHGCQPHIALNDSASETEYLRGVADILLGMLLPETEHQNESLLDTEELDESPISDDHNYANSSPETNPDSPRRSSSFSYRDSNGIVSGNVEIDPNLTYGSDNDNEDTSNSVLFRVQATNNPFNLVTTRDPPVDTGGTSKQPSHRSKLAERRMLKRKQKAMNNDRMFEENGSFVDPKPSTLSLSKKSLDADQPISKTSPSMTKCLNESSQQDSSDKSISHSLSLFSEPPILFESSKAQSKGLSKKHQEQPQQPFQLNQPGLAQPELDSSEPIPFVAEVAPSNHTPPSHIDTDEQIANYLLLLRRAFWPENIQAPSTYGVRSERDKQESKIELETYLVNLVSQLHTASYVPLLSRPLAEERVRFLFSVFQSKTINKHLLFVVIDLILAHIAPEYAETRVSDD
ncbi:hypothetical protein BSLG_003878 [Batrachochytrium salamandrivorans]|nr:hypothetical protein BSLG_003878 [Batrachochytrium salamandrivorans]